MPDIGVGAARQGDRLPEPGVRHAIPAAKDMQVAFPRERMDGTVAGARSAQIDPSQFIAFSAGHLSRRQYNAEFCAALSLSADACRVSFAHADLALRHGEC